MKQQTYQNQCLQWIFEEYYDVETLLLYSIYTAKAVLHSSTDNI